MYGNKLGLTSHSQIHNISFYVLGSQENIMDSKITLTNKEIMLKNHLPVEEGVYDPHMGTTCHTWNCATCGNKKTVCPGHFGLIDLKYPVKSPLFRDELFKWIKIVCFHCSSFLVNIKKDIPPKSILSEMVKTVRTVKSCKTCNKEHYQVMKDKIKPSLFYRLISPKEKYQIYNHEIAAVLNRIKDSSVLAVGKPLTAHPSKFMLSSIRVPPNTIRPDIKRIGGARSSNSDTTALLKTVQEINLSLPDEIPTRDILLQHREMEDAFFNLEMAYHAMIKGGGTGDVKLVTNTHKQPVSIAERLPKKVGRIRRNLMGKRVSYMIRSVITGDSRIKINEVGIPMIHARNLEIPEIVTRKNINILNVYYMNATESYPGCSRVLIKKKDYSPHRIQILLDNEYVLQEGDIVMRDMITNDDVLLNRQPSLLFASIQGMKVVVMDSGDTLRLNPSVCKGFNADFDGDQMNAVVPQDIMSRVEISMISKVSRWFLSPQDQSPMAGAFQDGLIGISELTRSGLTFNKWHSMNMFADINTAGLNYIFDKKSYSNRELVSRLLPEINLINKTPTMYKEQYVGLLKYNPDDINVNIKRGKLLSGVLDKRTAGQGVSNSIFHIIAKEYGNDAALETIYNFQQIVHRFFLMHGFTAGIMDINISDKAMLEVKKKIKKMINDSNKITELLNSGELIAPLGVAIHDYYENEQLNALSPGDDFVNPIFSDIDLQSNGIAKLILTGSKGKPPNFIAINGAIGIQTINGNRFPPQAGWGRTSPYFLRYDTDPYASGYISNSFREGIESKVYPFMAGEARHGMISNALSTSITGYQNRISIKNLESIIIDNSRKCTKNGNIVQTMYAECGIDAGRLEKVKFGSVFISDKKLKEEFYTNIADVNKLYRNAKVKKLLDEEYAEIVADRENFRSIHIDLESANPKEYIMENTKLVPVNIARVIDDIVFKYADDYKGHLNPITAIAAVKKLIIDIPYSYMNGNCMKNRSHIPQHCSTVVYLFRILTRSYLSVKYLLSKNINDKLLEIIIDKILVIYKKSLIDYGSSVGVLAAQCISEPMTQFILNSKHRTGGQGGTKTDEIVRIKEILGAKETIKMKNPRTLIMVKKEYQNNHAKVQEIANCIEMLTLDRFVSSEQIFYENFGEPVHPDYVHEKAIISKILKYNFGSRIPTDLTRWCVRFTIDKEELILKSMELETLALAIQKHMPELYVIYSPENADEIFIRCYLRNVIKHKNNNKYYDEVVKEMLYTIKGVIVRGISGLISTVVVDIITTIKQPDGSMVRGKVFGMYAMGSNMNKLLLDDRIDNYTTQSDSIEEIENIFGIVAARDKIINELIITLPGLNKIHCSVFADEMTYTGTTTAIQGTGLKVRESNNVPLHMSFQTPVQIVQSAAINGITSEITGVSGPLMLGTTPNIGTTYNKICINEEFISDVMKNTSSAIDDL